MARLLIGLALVTAVVWALSWALAHYGIVLIVGVGLCAWYYLKLGRNG